MSCIGYKVCTGIPWQVAGQRIPTDCDEERDSDCLGSYEGDIPVSWADRPTVPPQLCSGSTQILGGYNCTGWVSRYWADLVPMTKACPVTNTENLSHVRRSWLPNMTFHQSRRTRGRASIFPGGMGCSTHDTAYIPYVLHFPSGCTQTDLSTDYRVYFFIFTEWHHRDRNYGRLSTSDCSRVIPISCIRAVRRYGQNMTTTTVYIIQLFIYKN